MKTIKIDHPKEIPENYTGLAEYIPMSARLWIFNGKLHRDDGPAIESFSWDKKSYWYNGKELNKYQIEQLINLGYPEKAAIKLVSVL